MALLKVLVADDEAGMRLGVTRALRDFHIVVPDVDAAFDFQVDQAETGEQALEHIAEDSPDILLLDQKLPGISGLDVLEKLSEKSGDLLTIMITAYASIETAVTATKRGAFDFLPKPFTPAELKNAIRKAAAHLALVRRARELAEEKRRVRFEFIRVLGHELKAPLNAVSGYLQIMGDGTAGDEPDTRRMMVDRSMLRLEHMRKLIQDLLDMTRIEAGERRRELAEIDLVPIACEAIETLQVDADTRNIAIELHAPQKLEMFGDADELRIVLNNLVSNAVKYNRDDGRVDVNLEADDDQVTIRVQDTGIGMTSEEANKLFNDFVRIKNARTRNILGSGLGLSIVRKITALYQGQSHVESTVDVGSTFTITLRRWLRPQEQDHDTHPQTDSSVAEGN